MEALKRITRRVRHRVGSMGRRGLCVVVAAVVIVLVGMAWLAFAPATTDEAVVLVNSSDAAAVVSVKAAMASRGIPAFVDDAGRLCVARSDIAAAKEVLGNISVAPEASSSAFEQLARENDIWCSQAQNEKRWQAAKMSALSRMIGMFPAVRSAEVIYEPGSPRRLGSPAVEPTAAVKVTLKDGESMSGKLVTAIADLVSGSITGMKRQNVRIIDSNGESHRLRDDVDAVVVLRDTGSSQKISASPVRTEPSAMPSTPNIFTAMPSAIESLRPAGVPAVDNSRIYAAGACVLAGAICCVILAIRLRGRLRRITSAGGRLPASANAGIDTAPSLDIVPGRPFAFLQDVPVEAISAMLREEHPQTIAMVLVHLGPARAAAVLASLDAQRQVDIARRIAAMNRIDPAVLGEAENALCERLRESSAQTAGGIEGVSTVARILHHAGYATEKAVLEGLSGDEPSLADSIRRRMFEYEDIVLLPAHRLRAALERVDVEELAVSLRTAGESFREKLFSAVPARTARRIREEMDRIGPVRLSDVEAAQQHVVEVVRQSETGEYISAGKVPRGEVLA